MLHADTANTTKRDITTHLPTANCHLLSAALIGPTSGKPYMSSGNGHGEMSERLLVGLVLDEMR
jgi:hypothetical protein